MIPPVSKLNTRFYYGYYCVKCVLYNYVLDIVATFFAFLLPCISIAFFICLFVSSIRLECFTFFKYSPFRSRSCISRKLFVNAEFIFCQCHILGIGYCCNVDLTRSFCIVLR